MVEVIVGQNVIGQRAAEKSITFDAIMRQYQARVARYILRLVNDPELALDLTQDTFVNAFRNIHNLRSELALSAWLYRIATNLAIHARSKSRRIRWQPLAEYENCSRIAVSAPDDQVIDREQVHRVLMQLPRDRAACLILHVKEGFSYGEVAAIMGTTPEGARKRIARAKEQFRAIYDASQQENSRHAL
ncbi:MAG: polymerase sigma factor [Chloroflexi bacterium]|nr:polymerase sigma factor [Chloroflexota bacterium]